MDLFVYKLVLKDKYHDFAAWDQAVQDAFKKHGEFLKSAVDSGRAVMVGRTDTQLKDNFGLLVFKSKNLEEARQFMELDPILQAGVMNAEVFPFKLLMVTDEAKKWNIW